MESRWFYNLTGMEEMEWDFKMESLPQNVVKDCGKFKQLSIHELEEKISGMKKRNMRKIKIYIRDKFVKNDEFDTSALQTYGPKRAMYLVASNFNCLECGSFYTNPYNGHHLEGLMTDCTQGPSASAGAGHGAILRLSINRHNPINLLDSLKIKLRNGKLECPEKPISVNYKNIKIGLHTDVKACYYRTNYKFKYRPNGPEIDQVFTSTLICRRNSNSSVDSFLKAAYYGVYMAAAIRKSLKLVLTLIGGGSFANSRARIVKALMDAHNKYNIYLPDKCEVVLPIYDVNPSKLTNEFKKYENIDIINIK